ncbi:hypothetical protein Salat_2043000 [Sesamum alatum]|uniref:Uncharacterized protein n=1 Tax=Sesamum alatum TaxID=300844 RepID=A0AAE1XZK4_9LAMI|nr:hypothetical protein Salat_2043000 [Sesamum alatum]
MGCMQNNAKLRQVHFVEPDLAAGVRAITVDVSGVSSRYHVRPADSQAPLSLQSSKLQMRNIQELGCCELSETFSHPKGLMLEEREVRETRPSLHGGCPWGTYGIFHDPPDRIESLIGEVTANNLTPKVIKGDDTELISLPFTKRRDQHGVYVVGVDELEWAAAYLTPLVFADRYANSFYLMPTSECLVEEGTPVFRWAAPIYEALVFDTRLGEQTILLSVIISSQPSDCLGPGLTYGGLAGGIPRHYAWPTLPPPT